MDSYIEYVGETTDDIHLLFEVNNSFIIVVIDSCNSAQQGTHGLPSDEFLLDISALFIESHIAYLEDFFDDLLLL